MTTDTPAAGPDLGPSPAGSPAPAAPPAPDTPLSGPLPSFDLLHNVEMAVTVELGRTRMLLRDLLALRPGSVVELDRATNSPVDILVNGTLLARGEVVVVDDELGVRITEVGRPDREG
ncbi:flagellar motor switch protein FliN [Acidiferrimicrobium sp. IK]|uniref:flagellar motor switch protein FliN n=1 Tax=Acidiferrimicrobium sp. IK TaxID=2871700 RepID=UPI0021CB0373|nr:flagellar motor switch protein FliN [Acidiferrimicrobium sp. IK]MCU4185018.1 flagellar motor switch protein FliN [Acidiferrimicrobium sp. IK]